MKFTNGYWLMKEEINPNFAVEYFDHDVKNNELIIYAAVKHIGDNGDTLNSPLLWISLSSKTEGTIKVKIEHFRGYKRNIPKFEVVEKNNIEPKIKDTEKELIFIAGSMKCVISKEANSWSMVFYDIETNTLLTETSYRNMAYMYNKIEEQGYITDQLYLDIGEKIYGLGERFGNLAKNGQQVDMWNEDGGTISEIAYKNIPFYISSKGYGVFVNDTSDVSYEIGTENVERVRISVKGEALEYYIINGPTPKKVLQRYTDLLGKPALPPAWSFGLWLSTSFTTEYDEKTTSSFIDGMEEREIPVSVFHFDCFWMKAYEWCDLTWNPDTFDNPREMLDRYHKDKGLKICCWINPYIAQKGSIFDEAMEKGYLLKKTDGSVMQTDMWQSGMGIVDFTNPDAYKWFQEKLRILLEMGVDTLKTDFGERIPVKDIDYFDGSNSLHMHNFYTYLYNKCVFEVLEEVRGKGEACLFARSATAGSQKFPAHWGGDCEATYSSMAETLRGGISLSYAGFGFWSHDISGFELTATPDLYKRWTQFGMLSTHSRLHGSTSYRVPWNFDEESSKVLKNFTLMKHKLMPYIYTEAVKSHKIGIPVLRGLQIDFPEDKIVHAIDTQYMFGEKIIVAPIFNELGKVEYYLPQGKWTNYITNEVVEGGKYIIETHDYSSLPMMVKPNTILATGTNFEKIEYEYDKNIEFQIFELEDDNKVEFEVVDCKGNYRVQGYALKNNNKIEFNVEGTNGYRIILRNVKASSVSDGKLEIKNNNTIITAENNITIIL